MKVKGLNDRFIGGILKLVAMCCYAVLHTMRSSKVVYML